MQPVRRVVRVAIENGELGDGGRTVLEASAELQPINPTTATVNVTSAREPLPNGRRRGGWWRSETGRRSAIGIPRVALTRSVPVT